jgi:membrane-associated phospholipid phosphatase
MTDPTKLLSTELNQESNQTPEQLTGISRRLFLNTSLKSASLCTLGLFAGAAVVPQSAEANTTPPTTRLPQINSRRIREAVKIRERSLQKLSSTKIPKSETNCDEEAYASYAASFTKGLPHNMLGEVDRAAYKQLLKAILSGNQAAFESIPMGGSVKLANPLAAFAFQYSGLDSAQYAIPRFPNLNSEALAGQFLELLWHALTRDIPFDQYEINPTLQTALVELQKFPAYASTSLSTIFRSPYPGVNVGPHVSQFLFLDVPQGAGIFTQRFKVPVEGDDHMISYDSALAVLNGKGAQSRSRFDPTRRYIRNARDLGEYVHIDFSYQAFINAALIGLAYGPAALASGNPYKQLTRQGSFVTFGGPDMLDCVACIASYALKAAWWQKWGIHRTLRPEVYSIRVHNQARGVANYSIPDSLLGTTGANASFAKFGTFLLPMAYPEGSPTHPAYPSGHATIAGACVTILKSFFNEDFVLPEPVVPDADGTTLTPYTAQQLTLGGELNKLAHNIAVGRNMAGVHWRSDGHDGILLGEAVAIAFLKDHKRCYKEKNFKFTLTRFDGEKIEI